MSSIFRRDADNWPSSQVSREGELQNNPACDLQYCDARIERKRKIDTREMLSEVYPRRIDTPSPEVGVLLLAVLPQGTLVKHVDRRAKLPYSVPGRSRALDKEAREAVAEYHRSKVSSYPIRVVHEQAETFGRTAHARASPTDRPRGDRALQVEANSGRGFCAVENGRCCANTCERPDLEHIDGRAWRDYKDRKSGRSGGGGT